MRTLTPKDAYVLMEALVEQATGEASLAVTNTSDFVSSGETVLQTGLENTLNALACVIGRMFVAVRPYEAKLGILNSISTGGYTDRLRKISYYAKKTQPAGDWNTDLYTNLAQGYDNGTNGGASVGSMWVQNQPLPFSMYFGGSSVWSYTLTQYEKQWAKALRDESEFLKVAEGIMTQANNDIEMEKEAFNRMTLLNKIAAVIDTAAYNNGAAIDVIAGFNATVGQTYTRQVVLESHLQEFLQYFTALFKTVSDMMTYNSIKYHWEAPKTVGGVNYVVPRHTPKRNQRAIFYNPFFTRAKSTVFSEIFNPQYLEDASQFETVDFWQQIDSGDEINVTPAVTDMNSTSATYGESISGNAVNAHILGCLFDEDSVMVDYQLESAGVSPLEVRKRYRNFVWNFAKNAIADPTENFVVFYMGAGGT